MTKSRYITYKLGDNDFSEIMLRAAKRLAEYKVDGSTDDKIILSAMANIMAGETAARSILWYRPEYVDKPLEWYYNYFVGARIDRTEEGAHADGDHGYVSIDTATWYVWLH